jgi:hypothetical protein
MGRRMTKSMVKAARRLLAGGTPASGRCRKPVRVGSDSIPMAACVHTALTDFIKPALILFL